jgi:hypothetical protein
MDGLSPGDYVVLASMRGYLFPLAQFTWTELTVDATSLAGHAQKRVAEALPRVTVESGQTTPLTIRLERGAEISGTVAYDDGSPVINAQVLVYRYSQTNHEWQTIEQPTDEWRLMETDDRGVFRVVGLPAAKYLVSARIAPDGGSSNAILGGQIRPNTAASYPGRLEAYFGDTVRQKLATPIELSAGERRADVNIQIPLSKLRTLSGTVSAESDGHLLKAAGLQLSFADDKSKFLVAHLGQDGAFSIPFVLDGDYILTVYAPPEGEPRQPHAYRPVDIPLSVHEDFTGIQVALPDASAPLNPKSSP